MGIRDDSKDSNYYYQDDKDKYDRKFTKKVNQNA